MAVRSHPRKKLKFGPGIVRGWFDTVINPLLRSLRYELLLLEDNNWTWQVVPEGLESIRPVRQMVSPVAADNLDQFIKYHPIVKKTSDLHDEQRTRLLEACRTLVEDE
jgi:hypothetical protein